MLYYKSKSLNKELKMNKQTIEEKLFLLEKRTERENERRNKAIKEYEEGIARLNKELSFANSYYDQEISKIQNEKQEILNGS